MGGSGNGAKMLYVARADCSFLSRNSCSDSTVRADLKGGNGKEGIRISCQYIVSPHGRTCNHTVTQMRHPLLVEGRPNCARQPLASTLSAPRVAATSYCHPGHHANVVTPCLLTPCLNLPKQWSRHSIPKKGPIHMCPANWVINYTQAHDPLRVCLFFPNRRMRIHNGSSACRGLVHDKSICEPHLNCPLF